MKTDERQGREGARASRRLYHHARLSLPHASPATHPCFLHYWLRCTDLKISLSSEKNDANIGEAGTVAR